MSMIKDIILSYKVSASKLTVLGQNGEILGDFSVPAIVTSANVGQWISVAIAYDLSKPEFKVITSSGVREAFILAGGQRPIGQPWTIRLGGPMAGVTTPMFAGQMICLAVYNGKLGDSDLNQYVDECSSSKLPSPYPTQQGKTNKQTNKQRNKQTNKQTNKHCFILIIIKQRNVRDMTFFKR